MHPMSSVYSESKLGLILQILAIQLVLLRDTTCVTLIVQCAYFQEDLRDTAATN